MKPLLFLSAVTAFAALITPVLPVRAELHMGENITTTDQAQTQAVAPLMLYQRVGHYVSSSYFAIEGTIVNQSNQDQAVSSFDYRLINVRTGKTVAVSLAAVDKTIPPHGQVSFMAVLDRGDVCSHGCPSGLDLSLQLVKFNQ